MNNPNQPDILFFKTETDGHPLGYSYISIADDQVKIQGGDYLEYDVFIDITDVIEKKLAALDCLVSQGYAGAYARKRLEASDGAFGTRARVAYAEPFITLRSETHYYLPVTEQMLLVAKSSDHETMARYSYRLPVD